MRLHLWGWFIGASLLSLACGDDGSSGAAPGDGGTACVSHTDCAGSSEILCDPVALVCVECLVADDCASNADCDASGHCVAPTACENSLDCPAGEVCDTQTSSCVECVEDGDCADMSRCVANTCLPTCDSDVDCVSLGLLCDFGLGICVQCKGHTDCPDAEHCAGGACKDDVCSPGTSSCVGDAVATCDSAGTGTGTPVQCFFGESCVESGSSATCQVQVCTPSSVTCEPGTDNVITCAADGLSSAVTEDCSAAGEFCVSGACIAQVCTPGSYYCEGDSLMSCDATGTGGTQYLYCDPLYYYCDETLLTCELQTCTPNAMSCNGNVLETCNANGSGYEPNGTDCGATSRICYNGACETLLCAPYEYYCKNGDVYSCSADGLTDSLYDTCLASEYCTAGDTTCNLDVCTAGAPMCDGTRVTTCKADGSGPATGGMDCAPSQICNNAQCITPLCTPSAYTCVSGDVHLCAANGLSSSVYDDCTSVEFCTAGDSTCNPQICVPAMPTCNGTIRTTCNADGSGYLAGGMNCAPQYCAAGACTPILFEEDFEDGNFDGWLTGTATYTTRAVTPLFGANGTVDSLQLTKSSTSAQFGGLYHTFGAVQPARVSWWARPDLTTYLSNYFVLLPDAVSTSNALVTHYFSSSGQITLSAGTTVTDAYAADTWYHFELRNINWTNRTFDYYVNDVLRGVSIQFSGTGASVSRLDLYQYSAYGTGYFDEIEFQ